MNRVLTIALLTSYCFLAAFTSVEGEAGVGISGRVITADFFALGLFLPAFLLSGRVKLENSLLFYATFMAAMLVSLMLSARPGQGVIEFIAYLFNFSVGIALYNVMINAREFSLRDVMLACFYAWAAAAIFCLLQFILFPSWFGGREVGGLVGTFRNTGQAGSYFGVGLALFVPAMAAGIIRRSALNVALLIVIVLSLLFTVKRSAILGFGVGIAGLILMAALTGRAEDRQRNLIFFAVALLALPLMGEIISLVTENVRGLENRFERKVSSFTVDSFMERFFGDNAGAALNAFDDSPLYGVGPGNTAAIYTDKYEIHSTPLSVLAASGVLGFTLYAVFMLHWLSVVWNAGRGPFIEHRFMRLVFPMIVGLIISWGYTFHIRKREFWVLYATTLFAAYLVTKAKAIAPRSELLFARRSFVTNPVGPVQSVTREKS